MPTVTSYPTTDTAVSGSWTSPTNVQVADSNVASISLTQGTSGIREQGGYGFDSLVPSNVIITQVSLEVSWRTTNTTGTNTLGVRPRLGGSDQTEQTDATEPASLTPQSYDITSLRTWSASDLYDANFATRLSATKSGAPSTTGYEYDYVRVVVTYSTFGYRSSGSDAGATSGSLSLSLPSNVQVGDLMIAQTQVRSSTILTAASGWTQFASKTVTTTSPNDTMQLWWKICVSGEANPTFGNPANATIQGRISCYAGTDGGGPHYPAAAFPNSGSGGATATSNGYVSAVVNEHIVLAVSGGGGPGQGFSGYSGTDPTLTERYDQNDNSSTDIALASGDRTPTSSPNARSCTIAITGGNWIAALFGIKPNPTARPPMTVAQAVTRSAVI